MHILVRLIDLLITQDVEFEEQINVFLYLGHICLLEELDLRAT